MLQSLPLSPANPKTALTPFPLAREYPFAAWADLDTRAALHPVLASLWQQVKRQYWYAGNPKAGALFAAVYAMSRCSSFRGVGE